MPFQSAYPQQQQQGAPRMAPYAQVQRVHNNARNSPFAPDNAPPSSPGSGGVSFQAAGFAGGGGGGGPAASNFSPQLQQMQMQLQQQQQHQMRLQRALSHPAAAGAAGNGPHQQMQNVAGEFFSYFSCISFL